MERLNGWLVCVFDDALGTCTGLFGYLVYGWMDGWAIGAVL